MISPLIVIPNLDLFSNEDKIVDKINEIILYLNMPQHPNPIRYKTNEEQK